MPIEVIWNAASCGIITLLMMYTIPVSRFREAWVNFLAMQVLTWGTGLVAAHYNLIVSPVRLFAFAAKQNIVVDFFFYPAVSTVFYFCFPFHRKRSIQVLYTLLASAGIAMWDHLMMTYTDLERHIHWNSWIHFALSVLYLSLAVCFTRWFCRQTFPITDS